MLRAHRQNEGAGNSDAGELFPNFGFSRVTARHVAAQAGVSLEAIPDHSGSMAACYVEVLVTAVKISEKVLKLFEKANAATPEEGLRLAIRWMIKDVATQKVAWPVKLIEREAIDPSASFRKVQARLISRFQMAMRRDQSRHIVSQGQRCGTIWCHDDASFGLYLYDPSASPARICAGRDQESSRWRSLGGSAC